MEATARVYLFLTIPLLFFSFLKVSRGQGESECGYPNPPLQGTFSTLPQVPSGVQAILPSYKFRCDGSINQIVVQVMGESTRLDVQIWRPIDEDVNNGIYSLYWSSSVLNDDSAAASSPDSVLPQRVDNIVSFTIPSGIQVKRDDVMGYYIERNSNPIRMGYFNTTTMESDITRSVVYALENVDGPLCNISLTCDSNVKSIPHAAPIIHAELADDTPDANSLLATPLMCIKKAVDTSCSDLLDSMHDNPQVGSTAMPSITATKTISMMQPTAFSIVNPTSLPYTEDTRSSASEPPSQITDPAGAPVSVIAAVVLAILVVIVLTILVSVLVTVIVSKKKSNRSNVNLNLGITSQLQAVGGNSDTIEVEQNEAYRVIGGEQELATHTDESMYSYPVVDPDTDQSIETKTNNAYAVSIVTEKNEAYKPISTYTANSGTTDEYDYI